jgi:hypothetical protein
LNGAAKAALAVRTTIGARLDQIVVKPGNNKAAWYEPIVNLRPLDRVLVEVQLVNKGPLTARPYFVAGVTHTISTGSSMDWTTTYVLTPATPYDAAVPGVGVFQIGTSAWGSDVPIGL